MSTPARQPARPAEGRVAAVTGACTFLGHELIRRLEEDPRYRRVLVLDVRHPHGATAARDQKTVFYSVDLTQPTVDDELATLLDREEVDTVVHGAFLSHPTHATEWAHELEDVGTMHLLNACAETRPARLVMLSTTLVYGAHPRNPNFLTESAELRGHRESRFINDKVRADKQVSRFARDNPATRTAILRCAPLLGPSVSNMFTRFFARPVLPVMMGHDPLLQFVHEQDAAWALKLAVDSEVEGPFNIVGKGVLPYSTVLAMMGRVPLPIPYLLARPLSRALWATQVSDSSPAFLDFLLYLCVADGTRARRELGFTARLGIKRTIHDFLGVQPEDDATDVARAQG
jgi:UDP-glucose 4-epimerase